MGKIIEVNKYADNGSLLFTDKYDEDELLDAIKYGKENNLYNYQERYKGYYQNYNYLLYVRLHKQLIHLKEILNQLPTISNSELLEIYNYQILSDLSYYNGIFLNKYFYAVKDLIEEYIEIKLIIKDKLPKIEVEIYSGDWHIKNRMVSSYTDCCNCFFYDMDGVYIKINGVKFTNKHDLKLKEFIEELLKSDS